MWIDVEQKMKWWFSSSLVYQRVHYVSEWFWMYTGELQIEFFFPLCGTAETIIRFFFEQMNMNANDHYHCFWRLWNCIICWLFNVRSAEHLEAGKWKIKTQKTWGHKDFLWGVTWMNLLDFAFCWHVLSKWFPTIVNWSRNQDGSRTWNGWKNGKKSGHMFKCQTNDPGREKNQSTFDYNTLFSTFQQRNIFNTEPVLQPKNGTGMELIFCFSGCFQKISCHCNYTGASRAGVATPPQG